MDIDVHMLMGRTSLLNSVGITSPGRFLVRDGALADLPEKVICMVDMNLGL